MSLTLKPRLLFLISEDWYFWSHRLDLARAARDAGYEILVATRVKDHGKRIEDEGFKLLRICLRRRNLNPLQELFAIAEIVKLYNQVRPDIVHHVALKPILYGSLAARIAGVPVVVNAFAGLGYAFSADSRRAAILRFCLKRALAAAVSLKHSRVVVQNAHDAEQLIQFGIVQSAQVTLIRGAGVDISKFRPSSETAGEPVVILPSRMLWSKGVDEFISSIKLLKEDGVQARYVLAGMIDKENPEHISETQLQGWQKEGLVEWWGHREDMPRVLGSADIVVLPTYYGEGLPKVLLEAAACERPLVATDVPGCREVVQDGVNGLLVPPRDACRLAQAIRRLLQDEGLRQAMGRRGREIVLREFSSERIASETIALYRELLMGIPVSA